MWESNRGVIISFYPLQEITPVSFIRTGTARNGCDSFHWHEYAELILIRKGTGRYLIEDRVFEVTGGDVILVNPAEKHRVVPASGESLVATVIGYNPELGEFGGRSFVNKPFLQEEDRRRMEQLIDDISLEYEQRKPYCGTMIKAKLMTLTAMLLRQGEREADGGEAYGLRVVKKQTERMERILDYIHDNFDKDIHLEAMAQRFFMNASYFSEYFKKNAGINFSDYLARVRIEKAIHMLYASEVSSTETAFACGFNNMTSFYNAFRKITGKSPGDYRKSLEG